MGAFRASLFAVALAGAALEGGSAVVDQMQLDGTEQWQFVAYNLPGTRFEKGQTFTVGIPGRLVGLELGLTYYGAPPDLIVSILDMSGGDVISAPVLGSVSVSTAAVGWPYNSLNESTVMATYIDLTSLELEVSEGQALAFVLQNDSPGWPDGWAVAVSAFTDRYAAGSFFAAWPDEAFVNWFGDAAFKTFVAVVPEDLLRRLIEMVMDLNLQRGVSNSLDAKLEAAIGALNDINQQNDVAAVNSLQAFVNAVTAQRGQSLTPEQADALMLAAQKIIDLLQE